MSEHLQAETRWIYLSPHFDDVALSCGGMVAQQASRGTAVEVVTVFAAGPAEGAEVSDFARWQHERWGVADEATARRQQEDATAIARLGARAHWLPFPDAVYRGSQYSSDEQLFGEVGAADWPLLNPILEAVENEAALTEAVVCLPLGAGHHVDHQLVAHLASDLACRHAHVAFYEDFPYAAAQGSVAEAIRNLGLRLAPELVDISDQMERKVAAIACYITQIRVLFRHEGGDERAMGASVRRYAEAVAGQPGRYAERLWRPS